MVNRLLYICYNGSAVYHYPGSLEGSYPIYPEIQSSTVSTQMVSEKLYTSHRNGNMNILVFAVDIVKTLFLTRETFSPRNFFVLGLIWL